MCQPIVLSRKGLSTISQCMDCKMLTLWNHNLLLSFTPSQFKAFREFTATLEADEYLFPFPDGQERLVLRTPYNDICFTFSMEEWENFHAAMEEANFMQDIYQMMIEKPGHNKT